MTTPTPPHPAAIRAAEKLLDVYGDDHVTEHDAEGLNRAAQIITREYEPVVSALRELAAMRSKWSKEKIEDYLESDREDRDMAYCEMQGNRVADIADKALQQLTK